MTEGIRINPQKGGRVEETEFSKSENPCGLPRKIRVRGGRKKGLCPTIF